MAPLEQAFGWTRTQITTGPFILSVVSGVGVMFSGMLADRSGPRRVILPGLLFYMLTIATLMLSSANVWQWYGSWLLVALAMPLVTPAVWTSAVVARFNAARGLALAVALAGNGLSSALAPQIIEWLIEEHGWRAGYAFFPLFALLLVLPLTVLAFDRNPRPFTAPPATPANRAAARANLQIGSTIRSAPFLLLLTGSILFAFGLMGLMAHLVPIVTEKGLDRSSAAAAVGLVGLCSIIGRLTTGFLVDRYSSTVVAAVTFLLPLAPVTLLLLYDGTLTMALVTSVLLGLSLGAEVDLVAYLTARYFGLHRYATFVGFIHGSGALSVGGGPLVGGMIHDATGGYDLMLWGLIPVFVVGAIAIILLGRLPAADGDQVAA